MKELVSHLDAWGLLAAALFFFAFSMKLHSAAIVEGGNPLTPGYFNIFRTAGLLVFGVVLVGQISRIGYFLVNVTMRSTGDITNLAATLLLALCMVLIYFVADMLGKQVFQKVVQKRFEPFFDADELAVKLLEDIGRGAKNIRIYPMRLEAFRSFPLDIDGLNRPAYSYEGCRQLAYYLQKKSGCAFYIRECFGEDGVQARGNVSVVQSGKKFKFSHVIMEKK